MRVKITWSDIFNGVRRDPDNCMVARAIKRVMPCAKVAVYKGYVTLWIDETSSAIGFTLSPVVTERIALWDATCIALPFTIDMELNDARREPSGSAELGLVATT